MKHKNAGYTLDQTIIIVSIIAILSTIMVTQFGSTVLNRAHGLKVAASLQQISQADQIFKAYYNAWPHEATRSGNSYDNASALVSSDYLTLSHQADQNYNLLPGYKIVDGTLRHNLGLGGQVEQSIQRYEGQDYLVVTLNNIPQAEANAADLIIDGKIDGSSGRLLFDLNGSIATLHYLGTPIH